MCHLHISSCILVYVKCFYHDVCVVRDKTFDVKKGFNSFYIGFIVTVVYKEP